MNFFIFFNSILKYIYRSHFGSSPFLQIFISSEAITIMAMIADLIDLIWAMPIFWAYAIFTVVASLVCTLVQTTLIIKISSGNFDLFLPYLVTTLVEPFVQFLVLSPLKNLLAYRVAMSFIGKHLVKYYNIKQEE